MGVPVIGLGSVSTYSQLGDDLTQDALLQSIKAACAGGSATADYFTTINNMGQLFGQLKDAGRDGWNVGEDDVTGGPVLYVNMTDIDDVPYYISVKASGVTTDGNGNVQKNGTSQTIGGVTYTGVGTIEMTCGYSNFEFSKTSWWIGTSIGGLVASSVLYPALFKAIKAVGNVLADKIRSVGNDPDAGEGEDGTEEAEEEAESTGEEAIAEEGEVAVEVVAEEGAIALGTVFIAVGVALAVIFIALSFILHNSWHSIRLWNLTKYKMDWILHFDSSQIEDQGHLVRGPVVFNKDGSVKKYGQFQPLESKSPVPGAKKVNQCHYYDMSVVCSHEYSGIGYVMQVSLKDDKDHVVDTVTMYFDIPFSGSNSTDVTLKSGISDLQAWYEQNSGGNRNTQAYASNDRVWATTTYDYLTGKHPVPNSADGGSSNEQYYYQSVVTIEQKNLTSGAEPLPQSEPTVKPGFAVLPGQKSDHHRSVLEGLHPDFCKRVFQHLKNSAKKE